MTTPAPGWLPDPSGRHEYRYWDGGGWTPDVSDGGLTATDPVPGLPAPGAPADATSVMDPTYGGAPTATYGNPQQPGPGYGAPPAGYPSGGYPVDPATASGAYPPAKPPRSGPSTGLLVGLGAVALALVIAIVVVLAGGDDDGEDDTSAIGDSDTTVTTEDDTAATTDTTEGDSDDLGDLDLGSGDIDLDDPEVRDMLVDMVSSQLVSEGMTQEQAECFTNALLDGIGVDRLAEIGETGDMSSLTPEDMTSMMSAYTDCGLTDVPIGDG